MEQSGNWVRPRIFFTNFKNPVTHLTERDEDVLRENDHRFFLTAQTQITAPIIMIAMTPIIGAFFT